MFNREDVCTVESIGRPLAVSCKFAIVNVHLTDDCTMESLLYCIFCEHLLNSVVRFIPNKQCCQGSHDFMQ